MSDQEDVTQQMSNLETVTNAYTSVHGVLSLVVCAFGIPMNVLNITILTRKSMRTPVNCILTWLAIFDLLTMISYVPFSLHFYCLTWNMSTERNSFGWMTFLIFHVDFTSTTHTISIWLGVTLAMFRYKHIFSPAKGYLTRARRLVKARLAVFVVVVVSVLVMIPNYLMNRLKPYHYINSESNETVTMFVTEPVNMETSEIKPLAQASLLMHGALAKFLPCILMVVYGGLLVKTLRTNIRMVSRQVSAPSSDSVSKLSTREPSFVHDSDDNPLHVQIRVKDCMCCLKTGDEHQLGCARSNQALSLKCSSHNISSPTNTMAYLLTPPTSPQSMKSGSPTTPLTGAGSRLLARHQDNSRTTRMLLVVITLFLVTELPQAILIVLSATIPGFFLNVYVPLGDIMDMVALVNNAINFLLYCIMSRDFRTTLLDILKSTIDSASNMSSSVGTIFHRPHTKPTNHQEPSRVTLIIRAKHCTF